MLTKEQKAKLYEIYSRDVWHGNDKMTSYCTNKAAQLIEFKNGDCIDIEKQSIEKRFCFGESGYDAEDAAHMAHTARTSESYFKRENMRKFRSWLESIREQYEMHEESHSLPRHVLAIAENRYIGQPESSPLKGLKFFRGWEVLEAFGGSAFVKDLPGAHFEKRGSKYRIPTLEELDAIREGYEAAAKEHEKKVDTYLKKYGLQHVESWTYWREA